MNVYVESNFVIEIALQQEEASAAEAILRLAEQRQIALGLPAFAVCEPLTTLFRHDEGRVRLLDELDSQLVQLRRSAHHKDLAEQARHIVGALADVGRMDMARLEDILGRLTAVAETLPLDGEVFAGALRYRDGFSFRRVQDAIVYASVISHLGQHPATARGALLLSRDRDFDDPRIEAELNSHGCRWIPRFDHGLRYIQSRR